MIRLRDVGATIAVGALTAGAVVGLVKIGVEPVRAPAQTTKPTVGASAGPTVSPSPSAESGEVLAWGPTVAAWNAALSDAQALPVERAAGQVILGEIASPNPAAARSLVEQLNLAGVIVMGPAITTADSVRTLTTSIKAANDGRAWPTIVSTDQEGGIVARLDPVLPDMPAFMAAGAATDKGTVEDAYAQAGLDMHDLGFTATFAPVADVTRGLADPTMRTRSAGSNPFNVAATVNAADRGFISAGVAPVIKHFPGHGSVGADSHQSLPRQTASIASLAKRDLVPFASAAKNGVPAIMMGHIVVTAWGGDPASVNPRAYAYLRDTIGFTGLAVTDAINMRPLVERYPGGLAAVKAIKAGADLLVLPTDAAATREALVRAVARGDLSRARLDEAAARVILFARWQGTLEPAISAEPPSYAEDFSAVAATVASRACGDLVGPSARLSGGLPGERATLADALTKRGVAVTDDETATKVVLLGSDVTGVKGDVVVALAGPWALATSTATSYIALWGSGPDQMRALAAVLTGDAVTASQWPVPVNVAAPLCTG